MTTKRPASHIETEAEIVASIERGLADVAAGRTVPHDEAMAEVRAAIESAADQGDNATKSEGDWNWLDAIGVPVDADFAEAFLDRSAETAETDPVNFNVVPSDPEDQE